MSEIVEFRVASKTNAIELTNSQHEYISSSNDSGIRSILSVQVNISDDKYLHKIESSNNPKSGNECKVPIMITHDNSQFSKQSLISQENPKVKEVTVKTDLGGETIAKRSFTHQKIGEPSVEILGFTQKEPYLKLAVRMKDSPNEIIVMTSTEARNLFPKQLSKYYEQFIEFF